MMNGYLVAAAFSAGVKLTAGAMLILFAEKRHKRAALYWGLGWFLYAYAIVGDIGKNPTWRAVSLGLFASSLLYGTYRFIEGYTPAVRDRYLVPWIPGIMAFYMWAVVVAWGRCTGDAVVTGLAGLFMSLSGWIIYRLREITGTGARNLGITLIVYGLHQMDYPFLRPVKWFAPFGFWLGFLLTLLSAFFMVELVMVRGFELKKPEKRPSVQPGVHIIEPKEVPGTVEGLRDYPVLAFVRNLDAPEEWKAYRITNVGGENSIGPTGLPQILELAVSYLNSAREITPVVFLEGVEYLRLYNDFRGLAKFLSMLKDYVSVKGGALYIVLERGAWDERDFNIIQRLLL